jgi:hypothetical protein
MYLCGGQVVQLFVTIQTIPPGAMRYATVGDWRNEVNGETISIAVEVADTGDVVSNFAVGVHEAVEAFLCHLAGITTEVVDEHDRSNQDVDDPGNMPDAPYHFQHVCATEIERLVISYAGREWDEHDERCGDTYERVEDALNGNVAE